MRDWSGIEPMDCFEYQTLYDTGRLPERFWPEEIEKLKVEYIDGKLSLQDFESNLEDLMEIS